MSNNNNTAKDPFNIPYQKRVSTKGVQLTKEFKRQILLRKIWSITGVLLFVGFIAVAGWIMMSGPIKDDKGWIIPSGRESFGIGDTVIATDQPDAIDVRFKESWISPDKRISGTVVAGPHGVLSGQNGKYTITMGESVVASNVSFKNAREKFLSNEYIIRCETGTCNVGEDYLVKKSEVKGKVKIAKNEQ